MKYLLAAGASIIIRGKAVAPGQVAEIPSGLYAVISDAVKARLSESVAAADVDLTAYDIATEGDDGGPSAPVDPVVANAAVLDVDDWEDIEDVNPAAGVAFNAVTQAGTAIMFQPSSGTHYSGSRWANVIPAGDGIYAADLFLARPEDSVVDPGIFGIVGFSPTGLENPLPCWYGAGIDGRTATAGSIAPRAYYREGAIWAEIGFSAVTAPGGYGYRIVIQRTGTTATFWWAQPHQNNLIQLGRRTNLNIEGEADLFVRTQGDGTAGGYVTLTRVALTGLAIVGNRLVSAE